MCRVSFWEFTCTWNSVSEILFPSQANIDVDDSMLTMKILSRRRSQNIFFDQFFFKNLQSL